MAANEYMIYTQTTGPSYVPEIQGLPDDEFFWLDIYMPTREDLQFLERKFEIHPLTIEDIQLGESREKCEYYDNYAFLSIQLLDEEGFYGRLGSPLEQTQINVSMVSQPDNTNNSTACYLLIFSNCLISIHRIILPFLPVILNRRLPMMDNRMNVTGDWLAYYIIDEIVDEFTCQMHLLQNEVDTIEDLTSTLGRFDQMDMLRRIYQAHRRTTVLSRLIQPKIEIVRNLTKRPFTRLQSRTLLYLRDVADHLHTIRQSLIEFRESLDQSHDNYLGQSDIELAIAGHRMDLTVKKITTLAFMIGSAVSISAIMGVNTRVPFENFPHDFPLRNMLPFVLLLVFMFSICAIVFAIGRNKNWI